MDTNPDRFLDSIPRDERKDRYNSRDDRYDRDTDRRRSSRYDDRGDYRGGSGGDRYSRRGDDRHSRGSRRDYDDRRTGRGDDERRGGGRDEYRGRDDYRSPRGRGHGGTPSAERRSPTPDGALPLSQRRRAKSGWDVHAPGYEQYSAMQAKATGLFGLPGANRTQVAAPLIGVPPVSSFPTFGSFPPPGAPGSTTASNLARQSRRLYIGNITYEANEQNLHQFFSQKMVETGIGTNTPGDPILAVQVNHEKSYAFVEFRSAEDATAAMAFDGIIFQSGPLKIRRPKDYAGPDVAPTNVHVPGVVSTIVPDSANKIFVGGLPTYLNDEQVMELLKSFGELKAFNLVKDSSTGMSKGFAFFEYVDPTVTDLATQGLNGMELGDRYLVVQRASIGAKSISNTPGMPSYEEYNSGMGLNIPRAMQPLDASAGDIDARILLMLNMVTPEDLVHDSEYTEIVQDIKDECETFGPVEDIRVPRPRKKEKAGWAPGSANSSAKAQQDEEGVGRVYVKFIAPESAIAALKGLAGRSFAGRSIIATLLGDEEGNVHFVAPSAGAIEDQDMQDGAAALVVAG